MDGFVVRNADWDGFGTAVNNQYIVFDETQIKSATNNIGAFDPQNPDIRYSLKTDLIRNRDTTDPYDAKALADEALGSIASRYNRRTFTGEVADVLGFAAYIRQPCISIQLT